MNKIKFFVKFVVLLIILSIAWIPFAETFETIRNTFVNFFFKLITGYKLNFPQPTYVFGAMTNIVTFTALVLATPKIAINRKIKIIILGAAILFFLKVFTMDVFFLFEFLSREESEIGGRIQNFMESIGMVALPVVLWFTLLYKEIYPKKQKQKEGRIEKTGINVMKEIYHEVPKEKYTCPLCKKEQENILVHLKSEHEKKMRSKKVKEFLKKHPELKL